MTTDLKESIQYQNFYHVPGLSSTLINKEGKVIDLHRNLCPLTDFNPDGYPCVNSDNDRQFIHRLLALTFLPLPEDHLVELLDVNHIDGVKKNNSLENLEWCTRSENCFHAYRTGLRTDNVPVLVKDLRHDTIVRHYSMHECARAFDVDVTLIHHYLKPQNYGKVSWIYYVLIREGQEWPKTDKNMIGKFRNGTAKALIATKLENNSSLVFDSIGKAAIHFGYEPKTLTMHLLRNGQKPYNGWSFKYLTDEHLQHGKDTRQSEIKSYSLEMMR